jgi:N utilization substance protein B
VTERSEGELEPDRVELRRAARERALELLYEAESKGTAVADVLAALPVAPDALAIELTVGVDDNRERIDALLRERVAPKWQLERLAATDRAVLRIGAFELLVRADVPTAVVLNEAVLLAERFGSDDSGRFVNGVLGRLAEETRPEA